MPLRTGRFSRSTRLVVRAPASEHLRAPLLSRSECFFPSRPVHPSPPLFSEHEPPSLSGPSATTLSCRPREHLPIRSSPCLGTDCAATGVTLARLPSPSPPCCDLPIPALSFPAPDLIALLPGHFFPTILAWFPFTEILPFAWYHTYPTPRPPPAPPPIPASYNPAPTTRTPVPPGPSLSQRCPPEPFHHTPGRVP